MGFKKLDYNTEELESLKNGDLKKLADYWLRQFLLHTAEKQNGKIRCPIKNKYYPVDKMHVSHFIDRNIYSTRFNLLNCHLISEESNVFDSKIPFEGYKSKHHKEYEDWLRVKIGEENLNIILDMSKELRIFTKQNYIEVIKNFRDGIRNTPVL